MKLVIVTIIALLGVAHNRLITYKPPSHMLDHSSIYVENLLTTQQSQSLRDLMVEFGSLNSNLADTKASKPLHEHIGEATAFDGVKCPHAYMVPDLNRISCILANRIDIGRHFLLTGGLTALKEKYEIAVSRLQSFGVYIFEPDKFVAIRNLFGSKKFLTLAQETCPAQKQVLDPFQFNLIVQVPGQTVATHIDGVYFKGADRFLYPQWLLAAMKFSGLFEAEFVDQIQVVAYFHDWEWSEEMGGRFVYWKGRKGEDGGAAKIHTIRPMSGGGSGVDGTKLVHAADVYYPSELPPLTDKNRDVRLVKRDNVTEIWDVTEDGVRTGRNYKQSELRMSVVYRARCFENKLSLEKFNSQGYEPIGLDNILEKLWLNMGGKADWRTEVSRLDMGVKIISHYIQYPWPVSIIPVNYCMVSKLHPNLAWWMEFVFGC